MLPSHALIKLFKDINLIDNSQLKARPKGPRNKRPPNAANRRNNVEQSASPLQEDPPMVSTRTYTYTRTLVSDWKVENNANEIRILYLILIPIVL